MPVVGYISAVRDLASDYAEAGFSGRLGFGERPAVLCVDVCRAYLDPASPLYAGIETAVDSAARVVAAARAAGHPVLHSRVRFKPGGADGGLFYRKVPALKAFDEGSPLGEFCPELTPAPGDVVITKQGASAFFGTELASTLRSMSVDTLVITGVSTSGCVRATATDALQNGFIPIVVRDACGDRDARPHEASLFDLDAKYADVVSEAQAITALRGGLV